MDLETATQCIADAQEMLTSDVCAGVCRLTLDADLVTVHAAPAGQRVDPDP